MNAPFFSTFSTIAELFVTAGVFYVVLHNYRQRGFVWRLDAALLVFEFSVNTMYMIFRMRRISAAMPDDTPHPYAAFMALHGILSLLVFVLLVVYSYLAYNAFKQGRYFFHEHKAITWSFLGLWLVSVGTGEVLYVLNYLL